MSVFSLHIDADHRGILFQIGSWIHNGSPGDPEKSAHSMKAYPYFSLL